MNTWHLNQALCRLFENHYWNRKNKFNTFHSSLQHMPRIMMQTANNPDEGRVRIEPVSRSPLWSHALSLAKLNKYKWWIGLQTCILWKYSLGRYFKSPVFLSCMWCKLHAIKFVVFLACALCVSQMIGWGVVKYSLWFWTCFPIGCSNGEESDRQTLWCSRCPVLSAWSAWPAPEPHQRGLQWLFLY